MDEDYIDALDCDCVSLEEAGLETADADTVPAALRNYYAEEYGGHDVLTVLMGTLAYYTGRPVGSHPPPRSPLCQCTKLFTCRACFERVGPTL